MPKEILIEPEILQFPHDFRVIRWGRMFGMPAKITKTSGGKYRVSTPSAVHAKGTTKGKAESQQRLLNAIDHGFVPDKSKKGGGRGKKAQGETEA